MEAKLYAGTYKKYNCDNIDGIWIDCDNKSIAEIYEEAYEFHKDEVDPEIMFQCYEGFPGYLYTEGEISNQLETYFNTDENTRNMIDMVNNEMYHEKIINGEYTEYEDWNDVFCTWMNWKEVPEDVRMYIDTDQLKEDLMIDANYIEKWRKIIEIH